MAKNQDLYGVSVAGHPWKPQLRGRVLEAREGLDEVQQLHEAPGVQVHHCDRARDAEDHMGGPAGGTLACGSVQCSVDWSGQSSA